MNYRNSAETLIFDLRREVSIEAFFIGLTHYTHEISRNKRFYLVSADIHPEDSFNWGKWQFLLKMVAQANQQGYCLCGKPLLPYYSELHHALISRKEVMGLSEGHFIHHSFNVIEMHSNCHKKATRASCLEFLKRVYGDEVERWFKGIGETFLNPSPVSRLPQNRDARVL